MDANRRLQAALEYAVLGWCVVPLRGRSQKPWGWMEDWQTRASNNEDQIIEWWQRQPNSNIGIQFGPRSGIVDLEGDKESSEQDLLTLFDNELPPGPTFQSRRGKHRLFCYREDLPGVQKMDFLGVEVRLGSGGKGAYSVFPPSVHPTGITYSWLVGLAPSEIETPDIPDSVLAKLWNQQGEEGGAPLSRSPQEWQQITQGVSQGERNNLATSLIGKLLLQQSDVFSQESVDLVWTMIVAWNERNDPPIGQARGDSPNELRKTFESILGRERRKRANTAQLGSHQPVRRNPKTGEVEVEGWRLVIVASEPPSYRLFGPWWDGFLILDAAEMRSPPKICKAALEQKQVWLPRWFSKLWEGGKDKNGRWEEPLAAAVVEKAEILEADSGVVRTAVVAERILDYLSSARVLRDDQRPDGRGLACRLPSGDLVFKFSVMLDELVRGGDRILRPELVRVLQDAAVRDYRIGPQRSRLHLLTIESQGLLRSLVSRGGDNES